MKIVDLHYEIVQYNEEHDIQHNLNDNKYLLLDAGTEVYDLEISSVGKEAIYLKVVE